MFDDEKKSPLDPIDSGECENDKDETESARGPLVTRRNFLAACLAGGAALLLWPRGAKAGAYDVGAGWFGNVANGSQLCHNGDWIGTRSGWYEWLCARNGAGAGQWLRVAIGLWVWAESSNELYDWWHMQPLAACGDWNDQNIHRLWRGRYKDTYLQYWIGDDVVYEDYGWALSNEGCGEGPGGWWDTKLSEWDYPGKYAWTRRQSSPARREFALTVGIYNIAVGTAAGGNWDDASNRWLDIHTWKPATCADSNYMGAGLTGHGDCPGDIIAGQKAISLANRWDLFGGFWRLVPEAGGEALAASSASYGAKVSCAGGDSLHSVWMANAGPWDSTGEGHLHRLASAASPDYALDETWGSEGPGTGDSGRDAAIYTMTSKYAYDGHSELDMWVGGSRFSAVGADLVTSDATGRQLRAASPSMRFDSDGYDGHWKDSGLRWKLEEARFSGSLSLPAEAKPGETLQCPDPSATCTPKPVGGSSHYEYRWYASDAADPLEEDDAVVMAQFQRSRWGYLADERAYGAPDGAPAHRFAGLAIEQDSDGVDLSDLRMWVANCKWPGSIHWRALTDPSTKIYAEASGAVSACPGSLVGGGLEPRATDGAATPLTGLFRKLGSAGSISAASISGAPLGGVGGGISITASGSGEIGICQDEVSLDKGTTYVQRAWVKGSRAGIPGYICPCFLDDSHGWLRSGFQTTGGWQLLEAEYPAQASAAQCACYVMLDGAKSGDRLDVCGVRLDEKGAAAEWPEASWMAGCSETNRLYSLEVWLEGEIARRYDVAARAFSSSRWGAWSYSDSSGARACAGDGASAIGAVQVRLVRKPSDAAVVCEFSSDPAFTPGDELSGKYIWCAAEMAVEAPDSSARAAAGSEYGEAAWLGERLAGDAISGACRFGCALSWRFFADGEAEPCFEARLSAEPTAGELAEMLARANAAAQKPNCLDFGSGLSPWFTDAGMSTPAKAADFDESRDFYGANHCSLEYATTSRSCVLDASYDWKADEALTRDLDLSALYPARSVVRYGATMRFAGPWSAWCSDMGETRKATSAAGVYTSAAATGTPVSGATIKGNSKAYVDWPWAGYDGVASAW